MQTIPKLFIDRAQSLDEVVAAWAPSPDPADPFFLESDAPATRTVPGWTAATYRQVLSQVAGLARRLSSMGVAHGVPVAIWAPTSDRWTLVDMAVQSLGAITVGIYPTLLDDAVSYQIDHSESALLIVDNDALAERGLTMARTISTLGHVLSLRPSEHVPQLTPDKPDIAWLEARAAEVRVDDISTYIYTSGTTGHPKAVVLNHHNFTSDRTCPPALHPVPRTGGPDRGLVCALDRGPSRDHRCGPASRPRDGAEDAGEDQGTSRVTGRGQEFTRQQHSGLGGVCRHDGQRHEVARTPRRMATQGPA